MHVFALFVRLRLVLPCPLVLAAAAAAAAPRVVPPCQVLLRYWPALHPALRPPHTDPSVVAAARTLVATHLPPTTMPPPPGAAFAVKAAAKAAACGTGSGKNSENSGSSGSFVGSSSLWRLVAEMKADLKGGGHLCLVGDRGAGGQYGGSVWEGGQSSMGGLWLGLGAGAAAIGQA